LIRSFPVLLERSLPSAVRTWPGRRHRPESDLPRRPPGTLRVFESRGYHVIEAEGPLRPRDPHLVNASSVALVDMRPRTLNIEIDLKPPRGATSCVLKVGFRCRVTDPIVVTRMRMTNLFPELDSWLAQSQRLRWLAAERNLDRIDEAYLLINQRIHAQFRTNPPEVPGMQVRLVSVRVAVN
jgi:hypothetical protein